MTVLLKFLFSKKEKNIFYVQSFRGLQDNKADAGKSLNRRSKVAAKINPQNFDKSKCIKFIFGTINKPDFGLYKKVLRWSKKL